MLDRAGRRNRCACCNGVFEREYETDVAAPSIDALRVDTEEQELVCDACCGRLLNEQRDRAPVERRVGRAVGFG